MKSKIILRLADVLCQKMVTEIFISQLPVR